MLWRSTPLVPRTTPSGRPMRSRTGPCSMCNSRYAAASFCSFSASGNLSISTPQRRRASCNFTPSRSVRLRSASMECVPANAEEPSKLRPNRAPSSSAQSTRRTVTGGRPLNSEAIRRSTSRPASSSNAPSSHPPLGTESRCPPISSAFSDSPGNVTQLFPAASWCCSTGSSFTFAANHARAFNHTSVQATRCAPFSSAVRARSSFNSATARFGFKLIRFSSEVSGFALQHLAPAALTDKFSVAYLYFAPHGHYRRTALDLHSFETIVVVVRVLRLGGDHATVIGIVNHQIRVAANRNRSFSWEKSKKFCCASAGRIDETVKIQPPAFHSVRVQQVDALLDSRNSVGNIDERIFAEKLLLRVKRAMIRSDRIDRSRRKRLPQRVLVVLRAQRRRHHMLHAFHASPRGIRLVEQ